MTYPPPRSNALHLIRVCVRELSLRLPYYPVVSIIGNVTTKLESYVTSRDRRLSAVKPVNGEIRLNLTKRRVGMPAK